MGAGHKAGKPQRHGLLKVPEKNCEEGAGAARLRSSRVKEAPNSGTIDDGGGCAEFAYGHTSCKDVFASRLANALTFETGYLWTIGYTTVHPRKSFIGLSWPFWPFNSQLVGLCQMFTRVRPAGL